MPDPDPKRPLNPIPRATTQVARLEHDVYVLSTQVFNLTKEVEYLRHRHREMVRSFSAAIGGVLDIANETNSDLTELLTSLVRKP